MEFGMQFFPCVGPDQRPADEYFADCLKLCELCDEYGYTHIRTVEHYFHPYGGYSPNPIVFLTAAASQRSRTARMVTGAVLPVFNNPLKLAGEIGMLDAISGGRLEVGFARAFLPHEYQRFGISLDESVVRFDEGMAQVRRLLEEEEVTEKGQFHSFENVTSLPRPTQKPCPKFWTAAFTTPQSFEKAGRQGNWIMAIPIGGAAMRELCDIYREAWDKAGHKGEARVMLAFHMYCHEDERRGGKDRARSAQPLSRLAGRRGVRLDQRYLVRRLQGLRQDDRRPEAGKLRFPGREGRGLGRHAEPAGGPHRRLCRDGRRDRRRLAAGQFPRHEPRRCRAFRPPVRRA